MSFRVPNWVISAASCYSCIVVVVLLSSNADAFAGFSQTRFVATTTTTTTQQQQQYSPTNTLAFLQCKHSINARNNLCMSAISSGEEEDDIGSAEGAEELEFIEEEDTGELYEEEEEEEEEEEYIPLEDDPSDPDYTAQKIAIETSIQNRNALDAVRDLTSGEGSTDRLRSNVEEFLDEELQSAGVDTSAVDEIFKTMEVTEEEAIIAIADENERIKLEGKGEQVPHDRREAFLQNLGTTADAFPSDDDPIMMDANPDESILNEDLVKLQSALHDLVNTTRGYGTGATVSNKQAMIDTEHQLSLLDERTLDEIDLVLNNSATDGNDIEYKESIKNEDPVRWILYDMDFNVTNLMLASCKHNPTAPLLLNHWMPQLCALSKYADARRRDFKWTWSDCEAVDTSELLRYYRGLGYDEIPTYSPKDTNVVEIETIYDDEIVSMAAFENWMDAVYNPEDEDLYFDGDDFQPENNVYDFNFGKEDTPEVKAFEIELDEFNAEHMNETQQWRNNYVKEKNYTLVVDEEAVKEFRGYLVIACCGSDQDIELAERITKRMADSHGKQVHVETRVYSHARQSDKVYEIWLEGYDITLLHSSRGANYNAKQWAGPADVDDDQMDYLVDKVGHLISDDSRYSYHLHEFVTEV